MNTSNSSLYFGVVGEGPDATITAYGTAVAMGIPTSEQKAWACPTCTFWNAETVGRFCSMCGSRRFLEGDGSRSRSLEEDTFEVPPAGMKRYNDEDSNNDSSDQIGSTCPFVFSPLPEDSNKRRSLNDALAMRASSHHGSKSLETSFTVFGLLEENDAQSVGTFSDKPPAKQGKPAALSAKEFQMSFANWSVSDQGAWACPACTFVNTSPLHLQCEICGQNRPAKSNQYQSQRVVQEMMETSFRSGQTDFLKQQQEKIEEIEERVILEERMRELAELQAQMLADFEAAKNNNGASSLRRSTVERRARLSEGYLEDLERVRSEELEEQTRMEGLLRERRTALSDDLRSTEGSPNYNPVHFQAQQNQIRAQEQMLNQWKQSYRRRESDIAEIRRRQQEIMHRWQHDTI